MDTLSSLSDGFAIALTWQNLGLALLGCFLGTIIGALPGLGPSNGVAILIPLAFTLGLPATPALILLTSVYYGAMYGGRISSILLNIPGDEPALMTTLDGYPMAQKGRAGEALALSGIASFVGAFFATWGLAFLAPQLVEVALLFGPAEYFALFTLAFATLGGVSSKNQAKAALAAALGLGHRHDRRRRPDRRAALHLRRGASLRRHRLPGRHRRPVCAVGGLHVHRTPRRRRGSTSRQARSARHDHRPGRHAEEAHRLDDPRHRHRLHRRRAARRRRLAGLASSPIRWKRRCSDKDGTFGKGDPRGVAAPEAGNNAAAGGALVPMLALGVPGSGTTAVLLAMLLTLNITPGPLLFTKNPDVVWGLIAALFIGNVMLLAMNIPMVGLFVRVLLVPTKF